MLPAAADRTEKQNLLIEQYYAEYSALGLDEYDIHSLTDKVYADSTINETERACRVHALQRLEAESFEFHPAFATSRAQEDHEYNCDIEGYDFVHGNRSR